MHIISEPLVFDLNFTGKNNIELCYSAVIEKFVQHNQT
jgi:hypothetical protein